MSTDDNEIAIEEKGDFIEAQDDDEDEAISQFGNEQIEEEEEIIVDNIPLTDEMIPDCLSLLCKTGDGLAHAYVKFDCKEKQITNIDLLSNFIHLRYVDLSFNRLQSIEPLNNMNYLLVLKCDHNKLQSIRLNGNLPFLVNADFGHNRLESIDGINHPCLEILSLSFNKLRSVSSTELNPSVLSRLHTLELRGNKLESTDGICLPNLKNLFLSANNIKRIVGLDRMHQLTSLHLRDNQIETLDGFSDSMANLQYLNLRGNLIQSLKEVKKLVCLAMLRAVILSDNPVAEEDDYRLEVLIALRKIIRLDKDEYTDEEREEAELIYEQRRQEEMLANNAETAQIIESEGEENDD